MDLALRTIPVLTLPQKGPDRNSSRKIFVEIGNSKRVLRLQVPSRDDGLAGLAGFSPATKYGTPTSSGVRQTHDSIAAKSCHSRKGRSNRRAGPI